jgi:hypothetical protein
MWVNKFLLVFIAVVVAFKDTVYINTLKILPRHKCISINQQFTSAIGKQFGGKMLVLHRTLGA